MSRAHNLKVMIILLFSALVCVGCSKPQPVDERIIPGLEILTPDKIVDRLFSALQFSQFTGAENYFAREIKTKLIKDFVEKFNAERRLGRYKCVLESSDDENAVVQVLFNYHPKVDGQVDSRTKKVVEKKEFQLVKESGAWKIRKTGFEDFDYSVENDLFTSCLNVVMDGTIAQEKLFQVRGSYADSVAGLLKIYPALDEMACEELNVEMSGKKSYILTAKTKNDSPCRIVANTDAYSPKSYDECPSLKMDSLPKTKDGE